MQNPNASQWNIGCVEYQAHISHVGHVLFYFFFICARKPTQTQFYSGIWALKYWYYSINRKMYSVVMIHNKGCNLNVNEK